MNSARVPLSGWAAAAMLLAVALVAGCTGSDRADDAAATTSTTASNAAAESTTTTVAGRPPCERPLPGTPVQVSAVEGVAPDGAWGEFDVISFDGTRIRAHWFPHPDATEQTPAPTVLMGPGWSLAGDTDLDAVGMLGAIDIATLRAAGFNVLTWDPRGFGESDGVAQVNSADHEGRDVSVLLDWLAVDPVVELDAEGDPAVGMVGGSYGGGIQLVVAPEDCRVDALVPIVAWNSLRTSLYTSDLVKIGWANTLTNAGSSGIIDPQVPAARDAGDAIGTLAPEQVEWFESRGPGDAVARITAPTLFIAGTVDTLFTLDESVTNYELLSDAGVPVAMLWYCDGHGVCLTDPGEPERVSEAAVSWLRRYVAGDESAAPVAGFDVIDQHGVRYSADRYVTDDGDRLVARGSGALDLGTGVVSGPLDVPEGSPAGLATLVEPITAAAVAAGAGVLEVELGVDDGPHLVIGAPEVTLTYRGTPGQGDRPQRVFAQLVDGSTGLLLGNQVTPIPVVLDGQQHTVTVPLEMVAHEVAPGSPVVLQLVASTVAYARPQLGGRLDVESVELQLPVATGLERVG